MRRARHILLTFAAMLGIALLGAEPALAAGTWTGQDSTTTMVLAKNTAYNGQLISAPAGTPSTGVISSILWKYTVSYPVPSGAYVFLCNATTEVCFDTSRNGQGVTTAFAGRPATDKFYFRGIVNTSTTYNGQWRISAKSVQVSWQ